VGDRPERRHLIRTHCVNQGSSALKSDFAGEAQAAVAKLSVPAVVAGASVAGWGPAEWMYLFSAVFVVIQTIYLLWKWHREWKSKK
jgi:uncharacterized membrane protein YfcA